jgi:lysophospholipase L1-like esterase
MQRRALLLAAPAAAAQSTLSEADQREALLLAQRRKLADWGGLTYYGSDNAELLQKRLPRRVVFLGDEVTESWKPFFPGQPFINRGIPRQTAAQMLVRFRQDVVQLAPQLVVIQAGLNDIAGFAGPATEPTIADHFQSLVDLARANNIGVVLTTVTPVSDVGSNLSTRRPARKINALNRWLKEYAAEKKLPLVDLHAVLVQGREMKRELTSDGLLPNEQGYALLAQVMTPVLQTELARRQSR